MGPATEVGPIRARSMLISRSERRLQAVNNFDESPWARVVPCTPPAKRRTLAKHDRLNERAIGCPRHPYLGRRFPPGSHARPPFGMTRMTT
jgi:hypothetical protein